MESWNQIVNTALLGTSKRELKIEELGPDLADSYMAISVALENKEEVFLATASLANNYRQCGFVPIHKEALLLPVAEQEQKEHASPLAHQSFSDIIDSGSVSLLQFWLEHCTAKDMIVQPELIPLLLETGKKNKDLRSMIRSCCGKRGEWLIQFNKDWQYAEQEDEMELWNTGTLEQRKGVLSKVRTTEPGKAREMLCGIWQQENAATKVELLHELLNNAGEDDLTWLESLSNEKSIKVKEEALNVLKKIPSSSIVQRYWQILQDSVQIRTSKGMLGIGSKTVLEIRLVNSDESIYKTGIQQLSSQANISDESFILYQLMEHVPPHFWEDHFKLDKKSIINLFQKDEQLRRYTPAIGIAASRFNDLEWLRMVVAMDQSSIYQEAFYLLPQKEAEAYALRFLGNDEAAAALLHVIHHFREEWGIDFARAVLKFTAKNPYHYNKSFYQQVVYQLPLTIESELDKFSPKEEHLRAMWNTLSEHLVKLLALKQLTTQSFKA